MRPTLPECPKTNAVLAIHLDGDVAGSDFAGSDISGSDIAGGDIAGGGWEAGEPEGAGFDFACSETLGAHLRACAICQSLLLRARRLDAALAADSGRALAEHPRETGAGYEEIAQRWFAVAAAAHDGAVPSPVVSSSCNAEPSQRERAPSADIAAATSPALATYTAALCVLAAAVAAFLLLGHWGSDPGSSDPGSSDTASSDTASSDTTGSDTARSSTAKSDASSGEPSAGAARASASGHADLVGDEPRTVPVPASSTARESEVAPDAESTATASQPAVIAVAGDTQALLRWRRERRAAPGQDSART
ncbi:MAG: hypothetical protein ABIP94_20910, partial [Planctomycetota bacterium]